MTPALARTPRRLRTGFFSTLVESAVPEGKKKEACTSIGMAKYATPLDLEDKIRVDLIVVGSTAVCPETGARIGKGEGFAELEYGMLRWMEAGKSDCMCARCSGRAQM